MAKEIKQQTHSSNYRYILEPYRNHNSRFTCPSCRKKHTFTKYLDVTTGDYIGDDFGRCGRETSCGYMKSPTGRDVSNSDLFVDSSKVKLEFISLQDRINTLDPKIVIKSLENYDNNNFVTFLKTYFDVELVDSVLQTYRVGSSDKWRGSTIFWQIDKDFDIRTGKIMLYDKDTGKRVKKPYNHIFWAHSPDSKREDDSSQDYQLRQCFFGEHLLNEDEEVYRVVESEKTAILCSLVNPEQIWIATGGLQNINEERLLPFQDKKLIFYPDKGEAYEKWIEKLTPFMDTYDIKINKSLQSNSNLENGEDLADLLLQRLNNVKI